MEDSETIEDQQSRSTSSPAKESLPLPLVNSTEASSNSPSLKTNLQDSSNVNITSHTPSFSPSISSVYSYNETETSFSPSSSPTEEDSLVDSFNPSSMPSPISQWQQPTNPTADPINSPTTLRPTMLLEHPTQPPHIQYEYEINFRIALVIIATPMLIIAGCFVRRWHNEKKFERSYRDFEISAFSTEDHDIS